VLGLFEVGHGKPVAVAVLYEGVAKHTEHLLQNVLFAHELLALAVGLGQLDVERIAGTCLPLYHKEDEEQGGQ